LYAPSFISILMPAYLSAYPSKQHRCLRKCSPSQWMMTTHLHRYFIPQSSFWKRVAFFPFQCTLKPGGPVIVCHMC